MSEQVDPLAVQAYRDYGNALSIAKKYWPNGPAEVVQAAAATVLIHLKELRRSSPQSQPQTQAGASRAPAAPVARPAPAAPKSEGGVPAACPVCGSEVWDNTEDKKKGKKGPVWRCKNKECQDDKGFVTSEWSFKKGKQSNTAYAEAHAARDTFDQAATDFNQFPPQLEADDSLPF